MDGDHRLKLHRVCAAIWKNVWSGTTSNAPGAACPCLSALFSCHIDPLLRPFAIAPITRKIFGTQTIDTCVQQLTVVLGTWGYREKNHHDFIACLCYLLLRNRSPQLEALQAEFLEAVNQTCTIPCVRGYLFQISRALFALGVYQ